MGTSSDASSRLPPRSSLYVVYLFNFMLVLNFTIMMPRVVIYWEDLGGDGANGRTMVRLLPLAKGVSAWALYQLSQASSISATVLTMAFFSFLGNVLYCFAAVDEGSLALVTTARVVLGVFQVWSVPLGYIGRAVGIEHRSRVSMFNSAAYGLGYGLGPAIALVFEEMLKGLDHDESSRMFAVAPTIFMAACWLIFALVFASWFEEPPLEAGEGEKCTPLEKLPWAGISLICIVSFVSFAAVGSWEVKSMDLAQDVWHSDMLTGGYVAMVYIMMMPLCLAGGLLTRVLNDGLGLVSSFAVSTVAWVLLFDYFSEKENEAFRVPYYTIGSVVMLGGMQFARAFCEALITKLSPADRKQQLIAAVTMAYMFGHAAGGAFGLTVDGQNTYAALYCSLSAACTFYIVLLYRHLHVHEEAS